MKKTFHLQVNEGKEVIITNASCPLTESEIKSENNIIKSDDVEVNNTVACMSDGFGCNRTFCSYFFGFHTDKNGQVVFDCRHNSK